MVYLNPNDIEGEAKKKCKIITTLTSSAQVA